MLNNEEAEKSSNEKLLRYTCEKCTVVLFIACSLAVIMSNQ